ncbi:MAG: hypothetical protein ACE5MM_03710 [Nitrospiraceae bacterium]
MVMTTNYGATWGVFNFRLPDLTADAADRVESIVRGQHKVERYRLSGARSPKWLLRIADRSISEMRLEI